jgi:DNA-binding NarL/FixJ family response regulator
VGALAAGRELEPPNGCLTAREREVLALLDRGLSNKQIAAALSIELSTAKNHVHSILRKLHLHDRAQARASGEGPNGAGEPL